MSKYTDWLNEPIEYAKEIGDHLVYLPVERAVELMVHLAISAGRIEYLEEENDRYCNGYKGGCWTCESVADLNVKQEARIAELEAVAEAAFNHCNPSYGTEEFYRTRAELLNALRAGYLGGGEK